MAPYLETVKSFADVPITDAGVDTVAFLEAADGLVGLFGAELCQLYLDELSQHSVLDLLGSAAFSVVQSDLKGNITKLRTRYDAAPSQSATLEQLVENEKGEKKRTATEGLMWLLRGLSFTCKALQNAQANKSEELAAAFTKSYEVTLKKFHNFVVKGIFGVAMKACPYRADFYAKLAADPSGGPAASQEKLNEELDKWLSALADIVARMEAFYEKGAYGKGF
ncbi:glycolipid transfer protein domain-containing protein [Mucidula mucida]|nr:glycolipid transfer protein domain-containing protein [Mucidula mucida]